MFGRWTEDQLDQRFTIASLSRLFAHGGPESIHKPLNGRLRFYPALGGVVKNLLDMYFHLPDEGRRDRVPITLVGKDGHASLDAERLEDGFRNAEGQTIEWPNNDQSVVALACGLQSIADGWNGFAAKRW